MPKRSSKPPEDENQTARRIADALAILSGETAPSGKNPAAVALGQLGGRKGGPARAKALSAKQRADIARKAAEARWKKKG